MSKLNNFLTGKIVPTTNDLFFLLQAYNRVKYKPENRQKAHELMNLINSIPYKTNWKMINLSAPTLFHGTNKILPSGYPDKPEGSWFAKSPHQAILHTITREPAYLYVYHLRTKPRLIDIKTSNDFRNLGNHLLRYNNKPMNFAFSERNRNMSKTLCQRLPHIADGWHFPRDQDQVMLCNPKKFLKLYKVYKITGAKTGLHVNFVTNTSYNRAYFKRPRGIKYGLINRSPRNA